MSSPHGSWPAFCSPWAPLVPLYPSPFWLQRVLERFKQVKLPLTVKYIDPTYMIRAIKPNANDSVYCSMLSHNAVHAAMAGYTAITVGQINSRYVMLPIACVTKNPQHLGIYVITAFGAGAEVRRLECEHLSLTFGERNLPTTLMEQVKGGEVSFFDSTSWVTQTLGLPGVRLQMAKAGPRRTLYFKCGAQRLLRRNVRERQMT
eukprot:g21368.t4